MTNIELKNFSKKNSTIEALTGKTFKAWTIYFIKEYGPVLLGFFYIFLNGYILHKTDVINLLFFNDAVISDMEVYYVEYSVLLCLGTFVILMAEILITFLLGELGVFLIIDMPLLLNRRFLPLTEEEIKSLPITSHKEFVDFIYSLCVKEIPLLGEHHACFPLLTKDIRRMIAIYIVMNNLDLKEFISIIPENLQRQLYDSDHVEFVQIEIKKDIDEYKDKEK